MDNSTLEPSHAKSGKSHITPSQCNDSQNKISRGASHNHKSLKHSLRDLNLELVNVGMHVDKNGLEALYDTPYLH